MWLVSLVLSLDSKKHKFHYSNKDNYGQSPTLSLLLITYRHTHKKKKKKTKTQTYRDGDRENKNQTYKQRWH